MIAAVLAMAAQAAVAGCAPPDPAGLRARDQALLDAIAPGDRALWDQALTADAVYVDENGAIMDRKTFLAGLTPLPANVSGHIAITDYKLRVDGGTAMVIHRDDEREAYHGLALRAGYLMTETWLCWGGAWKLALVHAYVEAADPPAMATPPADLDAYVGRYRAAPDLVWIISRAGDRLSGGRQGGAASPLAFETRDVAFIPGRPRERRLFQRDGSGRITGFIDRREGEDIVWRREP